MGNWQLFLNNLREKEIYKDNFEKIYSLHNTYIKKLMHQNYLRIFETNTIRLLSSSTCP